MTFFSRRKLLLMFIGFLGGLGFIVKNNVRKNGKELGMSSIIESFPLGLHWPTVKPFLFCAHHNDLYPKGVGDYGPHQDLLFGRDMGQDFTPKDGFRMYHGDRVPGFPVHPHRGFETITIVRRGYVDHADSLGAAGRYGHGDVQWMTAGAGIQHSEMFPLLRTDAENTVELFQIWLNLPKKSKMVPPYFKMFWSEKVPKIKFGKHDSEMTLIAGKWNGISAISPPPNSWAADPINNVFIAIVKLKKGDEFILPKNTLPTPRALYFYEGTKINIDQTAHSGGKGFALKDMQEINIQSPSEDIEFLILQASEIKEPIVQHGPFVMNTKEEIIQTIHDYQKTEFGGWPWERRDMVHGNKLERFAKYPDGKVEKPEKV
jgi:redox-sensitive bicupin YhaK (pirin superfamily)